VFCVSPPLLEAGARSAWGYLIIHGSGLLDPDTFFSFAERLASGRKKSYFLSYPIVCFGRSDLTRNGPGIGFAQDKPLFFALKRNSEFLFGGTISSAKAFYLDFADGDFGVLSLQVAGFKKLRWKC
jgi:hypothetical protein